ncbi:MAG: LytR/AlgR family response regulator transcription factor, partial [Bacteroidia bacterium]
MIRAIVIDDEEAGIDTIKVFASRNTERIKIVAATMQAEEGISLIEDYRPDVVFLDISMPKMNGFDLVEQLTFRDFKLVFTTAHQEYAIR